MNNAPDIDTPTGEEIKTALIARAEAFASTQRISLSTIGLRAVNDGKFFAQVKSGRGFNINTYQRVIDWLEQAEAAQ